MPRRSARTWRACGPRLQASPLSSRRRPQNSKMIAIPRCLLLPFLALGFLNGCMVNWSESLASSQSRALSSGSSTSDPRLRGALAGFFATYLVTTGWSLLFLELLKLLLARAREKNRDRPGNGGSDSSAQKRANAATPAPTKPGWRDLPHLQAPHTIVVYVRSFTRVYPFMFPVVGLLKLGLTLVAMMSPLGVLSSYAFSSTASLFAGLGPTFVREFLSSLCSSAQVCSEPQRWRFGMLMSLVVMATGVFVSSSGSKTDATGTSALSALSGSWKPILSGLLSPVILDSQSEFKKWRRRRNLVDGEIFTCSCCRAKRMRGETAQASTQNNVTSALRGKIADIHAAFTRAWVSSLVAFVLVTAISAADGRLVGDNWLVPNMEDDLVSDRVSSAGYGEDSQSADFAVWLLWPFLVTGFLQALVQPIRLFLAGTVGFVQMSIISSLGQMSFAMAIEQFSGREPGDRPAGGTAALGFRFLPEKPVTTERLVGAGLVLLANFMFATSKDGFLKAQTRWYWECFVSLDGTAGEGQLPTRSALEFSKDELKHVVEAVEAKRRSAAARPADRLKAGLSERKDASARTIEEHRDERIRSAVART